MGTVVMTSACGPADAIKADYRMGDCTATIDFTISPDQGACYDSPFGKALANCVLAPVSPVEPPVMVPVAAPVSEPIAAEPVAEPMDGPVANPVASPKAALVAAPTKRSNASLLSSCSVVVGLAAALILA